MKVLVTGHKDYIGAQLVPLLKEEGHEVTGCDIGLFDGCEWEPTVAPDAALAKDIRQLTLADVEGHDCAVHLAAISNDPMGDVDTSPTMGINRDASLDLARLAKQAGIPRFLLAISISVYGKCSDAYLKEDDALNPLTACAQSKIDTERLVSELADETFTPSFLRFSTAYGNSPMLRIDLVVNSLLGSALALREIRIKSDGKPWRPLIHCRDIARAFAAFMAAPQEAVHNRTVNVGATSENYQVKDISDMVGQLVPTAQIAYTGEIGEDPRDYRCNFDLLSDLLPDFRLEYTLAGGMEDLCRSMRDRNFSAADFDSGRYVRLRMLEARMHLLENRRAFA